MKEYREKNYRGNGRTDSGQSGRSSSERARMAARRRRMRRRRRNRQIAIRIGLMAAAAIAILFTVTRVGQWKHDQGIVAAAGNGETKKQMKVVQTPPDYDVQLLTVNEYSRPGTPIDEVNGIVVHYTANPGTTAQQNRNYFEGLKDSHDTSASSHFIIGMEGELVQCIPCNEVAYASNDRNHDTISIECCIPDETGMFTDETYDTLVHLISWLCGRYGLSTQQVIRHYDITGKMCPKYYVENEDAWEQLKRDVEQYIEDNGVMEEESA